VSPIRKTAKEHAVRQEGPVEVEPVPITKGDTVSVRYDGILSQHGADQVFLHVGFGPTNYWTNVRDIPMEKKGKMWEAKVPEVFHNRLNFCFKDSAGHWDNNQGKNWTFTVHDGGTVT